MNNCSVGQRRDAVIARLCITMFALLGVYGHAAAQVSAGDHQIDALSVFSPLASTNIISGERLSDWLLRNPRLPYESNQIHWRLPSERGAQLRLRQAIVERLSAAHAPQQLVDFVGALEPTGRLVVASSDARWLQFAPDQDPVLEVTHTVLRPKRSSLVTLLRTDGSLCAVPHVPGALMRDYMRVCMPAQAADDVNWGWIVQPDGRTRRFGVALWNEEPQDEPASGAWIWAPTARAAISEATSDNLARFLATQLPVQSLQAIEGSAVAHSLEQKEIRDLAAMQPDLSPNGLSPSNLLPLNLSLEMPRDAPGTSPAPIPSASNGVSPRSLPLTASDFGEIGLLQTPTARMESAGAARVHISRVDPYGRVNVFLQPLDWMEAGFRYTSISNVLYGPDISTQAYLDKSIDVKLRLMPEEAKYPQIAVGMRDIGGTGLFSSEYLVASKRWGDFDASMGMAWGYSGSRGNVDAPFAFLGNGFRTRSAPDAVTGGTLNTASMFHGDAALFGGIQWRLPGERWIFKAELDGNDYRAEPFANSMAVSSPLNLGLVYRYSSNVDFSAAMERGSQWMLGVTLHASVNEFQSPKPLDPPVPPVRPRAFKVSTTAADWQKSAADVQQLTGWRVVQIGQSAGTVVLDAQTDGAVYLQDRIEKAVTVLHRDSPDFVKHFVLHLSEYAVALADVEIDRTEWVQSKTQAVAPSLKLPVQSLMPPFVTQAPKQLQQGDSEVLSERYQSSNSPESRLRWGPSYSQILGGPDGYVLYQAGLQANFTHYFARDTWFMGDANLRLLDNYGGFTYDAPSNLPRVRTYARQYVETSNVTLPVLQVTHVEDLGAGHYASIYGGMLESMFGGVGAEWLYRPWQSPFAFGVDVNHVQQRDFSQGISLRDYSVNTGHATLYLDTGRNDVQVKVMAGQYLAGDTGYTLDISRVFANGVSIGAWATKTNVSAQQFGEGSFDKGIYLNIPFDLMLPMSSSGNARVAWTPLTRDGGARLNRQFSLFDLTSYRSQRAWQWKSGPFGALPERLISAQDKSYVLVEPTSMFDYPLTLAKGTTQQIAEIPASTWLVGGALVLASSALDSKADQWAVNHQGENWQKLGTAFNNIPYALAVGAGLAYVGIAGDDMADTATASLVAGAYTMGVNAVTKYVIGRARPADNVGSNSFQGLTDLSAQSSFTSNHVALAFAIATPFAQQYNQPWLYGLAGISAVGRIQEREHWLSDTVAGGLMGYAIGSITSQQRARAHSGLRLTATLQSVDATWLF